MRAALYLRVSTLKKAKAEGDAAEHGRLKQDVERQERELRAAAAARGWDVVEVYTDNGISGSKGRDQRPAFDRLLKDAVRGKFDVVMAWSVDRLGRSLQHLIGFLQELHGAHVDLFLYQQAVDTTTPAGKAMFQMLGVFAEFERSIIQERINSGIALARVKGTKSGKPIGRPRLPERTRQELRDAYAAGGASMRGLAKKFGLSLGTVQASLKEYAASA